jgi:hypothetical protein
MPKNNSQRKQARPTAAAAAPDQAVLPTGQKEFDGPRGLRLVVRRGVGELLQGDLEDLLGALGRINRGRPSTVEFHGDVLRAAVEADWLIEPKLVVNDKRDDVAMLMPFAAQWYARKINQIYTVAVGGGLGPEGAISADLSAVGPTAEASD